MHKASLSTGWTGAEKEFFVRNIPEDFIDWDLFRIFYKYGAVHSVRIPSMKSQSSKRYGFVTMEDLNGADEVRSHLKNGEYLITETGLQLLISSTRNRERQFCREDDDNDGDDYCSNKIRSWSKKLQLRGGTLSNKKCHIESRTAPEVNAYSCVVQCFSQDLPLKTPTKVRVVDSPHPCQSVDDGFVFHIIPIDQKLGGEYADLQRAMNKFCAENPSLADLPKVGQYTLFVRSSIAYRALCNSKMTVYLVDTGEIVPIELSQLWNIDIAFTQLPSLVIPCGISAIIWSTPSAVLFNNCRNALEQWSASYVDGLTATATHYAGLVNMICLEAFWNGEVEDFAASISTKGLCTRLSRVQLCYSRNVLLAIRDSFKDRRNTPPFDFTCPIAEILNDTVTVPIS